MNAASTVTPVMISHVSFPSHVGVNESSVIDTHLLIVVRGLPNQTRLENASGTTSSGNPYIRVFLHGGVLEPEQSIAETLVFRRGGGNNASPVNYSLDLLSGQGNP